MDLQQRSDQSRNEGDSQATSRGGHRGATSISVTARVGAIVGGGRITGGGAIEGLGKGLECGEVALASLVTVDSEHHSRTAVVGLTTVSPDGSSVIDGKGPGGEGGGIGSNWEEAGVEASLGTSGHVCQR